MPRFSDQAIDIFTFSGYSDIEFKAGLNRLRNRINTLERPLDWCFAAFALIRGLFYAQQQAEGLELLNKIKKKNKILQDDYIEFQILHWFTFYYHGINTPPVNVKKEEEFLKKLKLFHKNLQGFDEWELKLINAFYNFLLGLLEKDKGPQHIESVKKYIQASIEIYDSHPDERFKPDTCAPRIVLALILTENLEFEEARRLYQEIFDIVKNNNTRWLLAWTYGNYSAFELNLGNIEPALKYSELQEREARIDNFPLSISTSLNVQAHIHKQKKNFKEAEKLLESALIMHEETNDNQHIFFGHYNLFKLHYSIYRSHNDKNQLTKAKERFEIMYEMFQDTKIETVKNFLELAEAIINKHGSLSRKGSAIQNLHRLSEIYPTDFEIKLHILDLLFEELVITEDQDETITEIDKIIETLAEIPSRHSSTMIISFVSQQMILARYHYYIKGNADKSFLIYSNLIETLESMKLSFLSSSVENDLKKMENELNDWDNTMRSSQSLMERINQSKFNDYIQDALNLVSSNK